jgi:hypothetical protein
VAATVEIVMCEPKNRPPRSFQEFVAKWVTEGGDRLAARPASRHKRKRRAMPSVSVRRLVAAFYCS